MVESPARRARARAGAFEQDERVGMLYWCFGDRRMRVDPVGEYVDNEFNRGKACVMYDPDCYGYRFRRSASARVDASNIKLFR